VQIAYKIDRVKNLVRDIGKAEKIISMLHFWQFCIIVFKFKQIFFDTNLASVLNLFENRSHPG